MSVKHMSKSVLTQDHLQERPADKGRPPYERRSDMARQVGQSVFQTVRRSLPPTSVCRSHGVRETPSRDPMKQLHQSAAKQSFIGRGRVGKNGSIVVYCLCWVLCLRVLPRPRRTTMSRTSSMEDCDTRSHSSLRRGHRTNRDNDACLSPAREA